MGGEAGCSGVQQAALLVLGERGSYFGSPADRLDTWLGVLCIPRTEALHSSKSSS